MFFLISKKVTLEILKTCPKTVWGFNLDVLNTNRSVCTFSTFLKRYCAVWGNITTIYKKLSYFSKTEDNVSDSRNYVERIRKIVNTLWNLHKMICVLAKIRRSSRRRTSRYKRRTQTERGRLVTDVVCC